MSLNTGMKMIKTETVTVENAAKTLGSGSLLVYGTPAMLLLVEKTAVALLDGHLDEGMTTVGTNLNVDYILSYFLYFCNNLSLFIIFMFTIFIVHFTYFSYSQPCG